MTPHKHAEILCAIAHGRTDIEFFYPATGKWETYMSKNFMMNPIDDADYEWRFTPPQWQEDLRAAARQGLRVMEAGMRRGREVWSLCHIMFDPEAFKFTKDELSYTVNENRTMDLCIVMDPDGICRVWYEGKKNVRLIFSPDAIASEPTAVELIHD